MVFSAPIWLVALLPWAGVAVYLLLGSRDRASVPFLELWRGPVHAPRTRRALNRVPLWVGLLLGAIGVGIVTAAGPRIVKHAAGSFAPLRESPKVGIESLAVRGNQVMVRVLNGSALTHSDLSIETDGNSTAHSIDLPSVGQSRNYFFDLPAAVTRVRAILTAAGSDQPGRSVEVVRDRSWPMLHAISAVPPAVQRMIEVYTAHRAPSKDSSRVNIVAGDPARLGGGAGVVLAGGLGIASGPPKVVSTSVTAGVAWPAALKRARLADNPPPGWTAVVSVDGRMVVGTRERPARQVWIGFDSVSFARSPEFVIFYANVFDWTGRGGETFQPVPGTVFAAGSSQRTSNVPQPRYDLSPWLAVVAAGLSVVALAVAPKRVP